MTLVEPGQEAARRAWHKDAQKFRPLTEEILTDDEIEAAIDDHFKDNPRRIWGNKPQQQPSQDWRDPAWVDVCGEYVSRGNCCDWFDIARRLEERYDSYKAEEKRVTDELRSRIHSLAESIGRWLDGNEMFWYALQGRVHMLATRKQGPRLRAAKKKYPNGPPQC